MAAYYNEIEPYAAQWLRNLIEAGHIAPGDVDERSIVDVRPGDLSGYTQCHFFAGLGGWSYALRLAGWPDDWPVWTGSCPCQPFSVSGKRKGFADERHLWPVFQRLIQVGRPPVLFGEQVARAPDWLRLVRGDLVEMGYAVGAIPMEAASADADHFRDRYWFVADLYGSRELQPQGPVYEQWGRPAHIGDRLLAHGESFGGGAGFREDQSVEHRAEPDNDGHRMLVDCYCDGSPAGVPRSDTRQEGLAEELDHAGRQHSALVNGPGFGWGEGWTEHELRSRGSPLPSQVSTVANTSNAPMESGAGSLHPEFAGWELGYPPEWLSCAPSETPSTLARQRSSSAPISTADREEPHNDQD